MMTSPTKNKLIEYYENEYWTSHFRSSKVKNAVYSNDYKNNPRVIHQVDFVISEIKKIHETLNVLEIGAAAAYASLLLRERVEGNVILNVCESGKIGKAITLATILQRLQNTFHLRQSRFTIIYTLATGWSMYLI